MKQVNNLTELKNILTDDDFNANEIEIRFRKTKTTFYYVINNIYAIYFKDKIIGLYDADNNVLKCNKETRLKLKLKVWKEIPKLNIKTEYVDIDIDEFTEENGLICGTEDLFSYDHA